MRSMLCEELIFRMYGKNSERSMRLAAKPGAIITLNGNAIIEDMHHANIVFSLRFTPKKLADHFNAQTSHVYAKVTSQHYPDL